ncbi:DUF971 domain-containing protein [thermophilic bacterium 2918]|uniref:DUF971 domain-containing protein n=1 Tax=Thermogemmata fonticola TaxID=2755323 RepID=A0A7V8VE86_9BACT|nr:DUF971 domain-containing protein [Thermogemmata fonticola]
MVAELWPVALRNEGDGLRIEWNDGVATFVRWQTLRENCPCASCIEERQRPPDPFRVLSPQEVAAGTPRPRSMTPVGRYAYQIVWNDGHATGIYTLERLRQLSQPLSMSSKSDAVSPPESP